MSRLRYDQALWAAILDLGEKRYPHTSEPLEFAVEVIDAVERHLNANRCPCACCPHGRVDAVDRALTATGPARPPISRFHLFELLHDASKDLSQRGDDIWNAIAATGPGSGPWCDCPMGRCDSGSQSSKVCRIAANIPKPAAPQADHRAAPADEMKAKRLGNTDGSYMEEFLADPRNRRVFNEEAAKEEAEEREPTWDDCVCTHAPEQHGSAGCSVIALMRGHCPCKWNGIPAATGPGRGAACPGYPTWERPKYAIHCAGCSNPSSKPVAPQTDHRAARAVDLVQTACGPVHRDNFGALHIPAAPAELATPPSGSPPPHIDLTCQHGTGAECRWPGHPENAHLRSHPACPSEFREASGSPPGAAEGRLMGAACTVCPPGARNETCYKMFCACECHGRLPPESPDGSRGTR